MLIHNCNPAEDRLIVECHEVEAGIAEDFLFQKASCGCEGRGVDVSRVVLAPEGSTGLRIRQVGRNHRNRQSHSEEGIHDITADLRRIPLCQGAGIPQELWHTYSLSPLSSGYFARIMSREK